MTIYNINSRENKRKIIKLEVCVSGLVYVHYEIPSLVVEIEIQVAMVQTETLLPGAYHAVLADSFEATGCVVGVAAGRTQHFCVRPAGHKRCGLRTFSGSCTQRQSDGIIALSNAFTSKTQLFFVRQKQTGTNFRQQKNQQL